MCITFIALSWFLPFDFRCLFLSLFSGNWLRGQNFIFVEITTIAADETPFTLSFVPKIYLPVLWDPLFRIWIDGLHAWCKWGKNVSLCFWCLMSYFGAITMNVYTKKKSFYYHHELWKSLLFLWKLYFECFWMYQFHLLPT